MNVSGFTSNINTDADIRLYDENGKEIKTTVLERSITKVRVNIEILEEKTVPISYTVSGEPADGYRITGEYESTRNSVVIAGRSSAVQKIEAIEIPDGVVDVTGETENVTTLIDIKEYLPDGIILAEEDFNGYINVTVHIGQEMRRTFSTAVDSIRITGVPAGFTALITDPDRYCSITLLGLDSELGGVNVNTLEVSVDVAAWLEDEAIEELESGYYRIPISVSIPEDSSVVWETLEVQVHITEEQ